MNHRDQATHLDTHLNLSIDPVRNIDSEFTAVAMLLHALQIMVQAVMMSVTVARQALQRAFYHTSVCTDSKLASSLRVTLSMPWILPAVSAKPCCWHCRFFLYLLILFLTNQASIMGFRAIAAICRAVVVSNMVAFLYVGGVMLFNGFIIQQGAALPVSKTGSTGSHCIEHVDSCCPHDGHDAPNATL